MSIRYFLYEQAANGSCKTLQTVNILEETLYYLQKLSCHWKPLQCPQYVRFNSIMVGQCRNAKQQLSWDLYIIKFSCHWKAPWKYYFNFHNMFISAISWQTAFSMKICCCLGMYKWIQLTWEFSPRCFEAHKDFPQVHT